MPIDGWAFVLAIVIVGVLVWALATARRDARRARAGDPLSGWRGSAAWLAVFGATAVSSHTDGDVRGGDEHGVGGDWSGGHGGGDYGGGGWGGGDFGGGDGGGGGGGD
jgi:hypothetical protein